MQSGLGTPGTDQAPSPTAQRAGISLPPHGEVAVRVPVVYAESASTDKLKRFKPTKIVVVLSDPKFAQDVVDFVRQSREPVAGFNRNRRPNSWEFAQTFAQCGIQGEHQDPWGVRRRKASAVISSGQIPASQPACRRTPRGS